MTIHKLGWVVAAALVGSMVGFGFHAPGDKTGNVDVAKVFAECDLVKKQTELLKTQFKQRQDVIDFLKANPSIPADKVARFRDLSIKSAVLTTAEKTELEAIKTQATDNSTKTRTLQTKANPTAAETASMTNLGKMKDDTMQQLERWVQEFGEEMNTKQQNSRTDIIAKIQEAVAKIAKEQGYSIVFSKETAVYSANDLTAEAVKAVNKMSL